MSPSTLHTDESDRPAGVGGEVSRVQETECERLYREEQEAYRAGGPEAVKQLYRDREAVAWLLSVRKNGLEVANAQFPG